MPKVVQLHNFERAKRSGEWPRFMEHAGVSDKKRWRTILITPGDVICRVHTSNWQLVGEYDEEKEIEDQEWVRRQRMFAWVLDAHRTIGAFELVRYDAAAFISNEWFLYMMDVNSGYEHELSAIVASGWDQVGEQVMDFGPIIELRYVWIDPKAKLQASIEKLVRNAVQPWLKEYSIFLIKVFPLEYESRNGELIGSDVALRRRTRSMIRYARRFGFHEFPGKDGSEGWMYFKSPRVSEIIFDPIADMTPVL